MQPGKSIKLERETAEILDELVNAETKDIGKLMRRLGATPANFKEVLFELHFPLEIIEGKLTNFVRDYMSHVKQEIDAAIADGKSYINREDQISIYRNYPFCSEEEFTYAK